MNLSEKINQSQVLKQSGKSRIILANIEDLKEKIIIKELDHTLYTVYKQLSGIKWNKPKAIYLWQKNI